MAKGRRSTEEVYLVSWNLDVGLGFEFRIFGACGTCEGRIDRVVVMERVVKVLVKK